MKNTFEQINKYKFLGRNITDDDNHVAPAPVSAFAMFLSVGEQLED